MVRHDILLLFYYLFIKLLYCDVWVNNKLCLCQIVPHEVNEYILNTKLVEFKWRTICIRRSKKSSHGTSRSASVDRSGMAMSVPPSGAMPSQPFIQDPSMPILQPPSTTVQLEEAKRRLEESRTVPPVKSK